MNNMQFDEATQTHRGTLGRYRWNAEAPGQTFTGFNKPLQVTPDWLDQSRRDVFASFAGYWQNPWNNDGGWQTAMAKPWASRGKPRRRRTCHPPRPPMARCTSWCKPWRGLRQRQRPAQGA